MPTKKIMRKPKVYINSDSDESDGQVAEAKPQNLFPSKVYSASTLARNITHFETWSQFNGLRHGGFDDLQNVYRDDVNSIFKFDAQIPLGWIEESSEVRRHLGDLTPEFVKFMCKAHKECPSMFYDPSASATATFSVKERQAAFADLHAVLIAWKRLKAMQAGREKWSESDYASNCYNVFRSPAVKKSTYRTHCSIALPRAHDEDNTKLPSHLNPKATIPDCVTFVNHTSTRTLWEPAKSPFNYLSSNSAKTFHPQSACAAQLRIQATPCTTLPDRSRFEFLSSCWEDKKYAVEMFDAAYRQNRMAAASALRQLHAFGVHAPVFGLLWAQGKVRAHIEWLNEPDEKSEHPMIYSTPLPPTYNNKSCYSELGYDSSYSFDEIFKEWDLSIPHEILQVYFIIRNIDKWTAGSFRDRVIAGVEGTAERVKEKGWKLHAWKREPDRLQSNTKRLGGTRTTAVGKENDPFKT